MVISGVGGAEHLVSGRMPHVYGVHHRAYHFCLMDSWAISVMWTNRRTYREHEVNLLCDVG